LSTKKQRTSTTPEKSTLPNGLIIEEIIEGNGQPVTHGSNVSIKYTGTLKNGKKFDSNSDFPVRVGYGEVIKGMDEGLKGMKVGGKRKITIPPELGYGKKPEPKIPSNSTLIFTVELIKA